MLNEENTTRIPVNPELDRDQKKGLNLLAGNLWEIVSTASMPLMNMFACQNIAVMFSHIRW